jgi:hypothetical protein
MSNTGDPYSSALPAPPELPTPSAVPSHAPDLVRIAKVARNDTRRAAFELAKLWTPRRVADPEIIADQYARDYGDVCRELGHVIRDVRPALPWSVLRPLAGLPWWPVVGHAIGGPMSIWAPPKNSDSVRAIPDTVRRFDAILGAVDRIRRELSRMDDPGTFTPWLADAHDHLGIFRELIVERREHLAALAEGTRPGRLVGIKHDGKAQNLVRLRVVAANLALAVSSALPSLGHDRRRRHGALRAPVIRRTATILRVVYGVNFTSDELRDLIHRRA